MMENKELSIANAQLSTDSIYQDLLGRISEVYNVGRSRANQAVNVQLLDTYWEIGCYIVEFEQGGEAKAEYGKALLSNLSRDLTLHHGRGFSRGNLTYMRLFYLRYPICEKPSHILSWSHYVELLKIDDPVERGFYEQQAILERWSANIDITEFVAMPNCVYGIIAIEDDPNAIGTIGRGTMHRAPTNDSNDDGESHNRIKKFGKPTSNVIPTIIRGYEAAPKSATVSHFFGFIECRRVESIFLSTKCAKASHILLNVEEPRCELNQIWQMEEENE